MFRFYRVIFILVLLYIAPTYSIDECSARIINCTLKDGKHTVASTNTVPPRMEFKTTSVIATLKATLGLHCRLCQSNPASTIEWLFNGKPLIFKGERMHITSTPCQETLFLLTALHEDEGNFTCVARNKFGEANSTTEVKIFGTGCSNECVLTGGGRHQAGSKRLGPPKMKFKQYRQNAVTNDMVKISCALCESNPPSTLTWFFNGIQLDLNKNKIPVISGGCEESLHFRALKNNAGNYTCMAKNHFGEAYSTTKIDVYDNSIIPPMITVKLEAQTDTIRGNAVKIGARLNITCTALNTNCTELIWSWKRNDHLITQNETQYIHESGTNPCIRKLMIDKVMAASTGIYQCSAMGWSKIFASATSKNEISVSTVPCFKGFYCPLKVHGAKRCPSGTFSMQQDATNVNQCEPCPTNARNETLMVLDDKNPEAASIFKINCPYYAAETSDKKSDLSSGEIVAITLSFTVLVIVVILAVLYGMRNCAEDYKNCSDDTTMFI